ncbi:hypothetical protein GALMADRAFT_67824 [Galerina marginata CBS 339.88]|uniref:Putative gamma-glutamylcyclotransferase n=1 Tax=Galerina marginata (strain CBS 339.88) TaxID=685588 RepID=A0A067SZA1_GALM3|nr:hypothetical protein GALMADRAFT_67824 [Galerina marginata CBS 339.88]
MREYTAFFYGTLMHPKILKAVIQNDGEHLKLCSALLLDYTRHEVKESDYPGIIPINKGLKILKRTLSRDEGSVRGTLVTGLTTQDMHYLDSFEGSEYIREKVEVHPLGPFSEVSTHSIDENALVPEHPPPLPDSSNLLHAIEAETYVYINEDNLNAELWSFDDFVKNNAWKWYGGTR